MSNPDPFELLKSKKWPSITGAPQQYVKDHRDWIKRLAEEVLGLKSEVESLKTTCSNNETTINELKNVNKVQQNTITTLREELAMSSSSLKNDLEGNIKKDAAKNVTLAEVLKRGLNTKSSDFEINHALANSKLIREKEKRANNIMIFGLKCDIDKQPDGQVNDLVGVLSVNSCQVKRIVKFAAKKSNQTRPQPVLVEFDSPSTREIALKSTREMKCTGQGITDRLLPPFKMTQPHLFQAHLSNPSDKEKNKYKTELKEKAKTSNDAPRSLIRGSQLTLSDEVLSCLGKKEAIRKMIIRTRNGQDQNSKTNFHAKCIEDLKIPLNLQLTYKNKLFYFCDTESDKPRIIYH